MLTLDHLRQEFARVLQEKAGARGSFDAALLHVAELAYRAGMEDGKEKDDVSHG